MSIETETDETLTNCECPECSDFMTCSPMTVGIYSYIYQCIKCKSMVIIADDLPLGSVIPDGHLRSGLKQREEL